MKAAEENVLSQLFWLGRLHETARALNAAGVPFVLLKGASLLTRTYSSETSRSLSDIDLLTAPSDFSKAAAALESIGARRTSPTRRGVFVNQGQECVFAFDDGSEIDLHYRLFPWYLERRLFGIDSREFLEAREEQEWKGVRVGHLAPADEFVYLTLLAAFEEHPRFIDDLDALVRAHGARIDWPALWTRLDALPLAPLAGRVVRHLETRLGTPIQGAPRRVKAGEPRFRTLAGSPSAESLRALALCPNPIDGASLAVIYLKWKLFKNLGLFRTYFLRHNNPESLPF